MLASEHPVSESAFGRVGACAEADEVTVPEARAGPGGENGEGECGDALIMATLAGSTWLYEGEVYQCCQGVRETDGSLGVYKMRRHKARGVESRLWIRNGKILWGGSRWTAKVSAGWDVIFWRNRVDSWEELGVESTPVWRRLRLLQYGHVAERPDSPERLPQVEARLFDDVERRLGALREMVKKERLIGEMDRRPRSELCWANLVGDLRRLAACDGGRLAVTKEVPNDELHAALESLVRREKLRAAEGWRRHAEMKERREREKREKQQQWW